MGTVLGSLHSARQEGLRGQGKYGSRFRWRGSELLFLFFLLFLSLRAQAPLLFGLHRAQPVAPASAARRDPLSPTHHYGKDEFLCLLQVDRGGFGIN